VPNRSVRALKTPKSRTKVGPVEVAFPGHGHAEDNLVVYVPSAKVLFGGCTIRSVGTKSLGNIIDADLKTWGPALAWVKATYPEIKTVVPGHGQGANITLIDGTIGLIVKQVNADAEAEAAKDKGLQRF